MADLLDGIMDDIISDPLGNIDDFREGAGKNGTQLGRHLAIHGQLEQTLKPILKKLHEAEYHEAEVMRNISMLVNQIWHNKQMRMDQQMKTFRIGDAVQQKGTGLKGPVGVVTKVHTWSDAQYEVMFPSERGTDKQYFSAPYINHAGENYLEQPELKPENLF